MFYEVRGVGPGVLSGRLPDGRLGAVSALALAQAHPDQVHTVVAHEPPLEELLDDRAELRAVTEDIVATYLSGDVGGAWGKFLRSANITLSDEDMAQWASEPTPQAAADKLFFFAHTLRPSTYWLPDLAALHAGSTRIIVGIGEASTGQTCERTSTRSPPHSASDPCRFPVTMSASPCTPTFSPTASAPFCPTTLPHRTRAELQEQTADPRATAHDHGRQA